MVQTIIMLIMAAVTFVTLHYVMGLTVLVAGLIAIVLALLGMCLFVVPMDGDF